jgi:hypothetical protein
LAIDIYYVRLIRSPGACIRGFISNTSGLVSGKVRKFRRVVLRLVGGTECRIRRLVSGIGAFVRRPIGSVIRRVVF